MVIPEQNPLHLYRALLREASYLVHPNARGFFDNYIKRSFRRQQLGKDGKPKSVEQQPLIPTQRTSHQLKRARKQLYQLRRANDGHMYALESVFKATFARRGRRRREMLRDMMTPPPSDIQDAAQGSISVTTYEPNWRPPAKFMTLLSSQAKVQRYLDSRGKIKDFPALPKKNRWDRPFPPCRVKKILQSWYAKHANLLLPPLQEAEWVALRDMSKTHLWKPITRRPQGTVAVYSKADPLHIVTTLPSAVVATGPAEKNPQETSRVLNSVGRPHRVRSRYLRRIVSRSVLRNTPTVLADPESGTLVSRWDSGIRWRKPASCTPSQRLALFE